MQYNTSSKSCKPIVSVIMPAYNSRHTIATSIQSVKDQVLTQWELLIIDDCSTEPLEDIVSAFHDKRIYYIHLTRNKGVANARNIGIAKAQGRYIAFLDSDDMWHPEKLSMQLAFMQKNHYAFTYTWYRQFTGDISQLGNLVKTKPVVDYKELLKGNDIGCLTVMIDREQIQDIHMPSQRHEDYITWLNILKQGWKAYSLPKELAYYRKGDDSLTSNKWKSLIWTWRVYRESQKLDLLETGKYMIYYIMSGIRKHY